MIDNNDGILTILTSEFVRIHKCFGKKALPASLDHVFRTVLVFMAQSRTLI